VEEEVVRRVTSVTQPTTADHQPSRRLEALIVGVLRKVKNFYTKTHKNHTKSYPKSGFFKIGGQHTPSSEREMVLPSTVVVVAVLCALVCSLPSPRHT